IRTGVLMRKTIKVLAWLTGVLIGLPALVIILLVVFANVDWGRSVIERTAAQLSGGQLLLSGVSGHFPDDVRVAHIEVHDAGSPWLAADDITLRWSPSRLSHKALQVELLRVGHMELLRLPTAASPREESSTPFKLPLRIDVDRVEVNRIDVGAPIA